MSDLTLKAEGKTVIVTGGAGGIGRAGVEIFLESGANVVIADINMKAAEETAAELSGRGPEVVAVRTDVTDPDSVEQLVAQVTEQFSSLDILFNNAGICVNEAAETMTFENWKRVIDINLTGVFLMAQAAGRVMIGQRSGVIINTASMSAHIVNRPQPQCAYNASKAGVIQLTRSLAVEWAKYGVRVNSISPGYIATDITLRAPEDWKKSWNEQSVAGRMGKPEELKSALLYLASEGSSFATGADLVIDGGFISV